ALVGVQLKTTTIAGSFDGQRHFLAAPGDSAEVDFEQDVALALRVLHRGQVSALLPFLESYRKVPGLGEAGGGFGDLQLAFRWDFTNAGGPLAVPGLALSAGATFPTGRAPEGSEKPLATDATGTGAMQGSLSMALEQSYRSWLDSLSGTVAFRGARAVGEVHQQQGAQLLAFAAGGYSFDDGALLALTASYSYEFETRINAAIVPESARAGTRLGVAGGMLLPRSFRLQGSVFADVPIPFFGQNQPVGVGLSFMVIRGFS
ncbi:MAG: transporter, partial [Minicystis sp.]